jgi:aminomethyltransferase
MLLSGSDFDGSQTPLEASCEWVIDWEHEFLGRDALIAQRERGEYTQLHGVRLEQRGVPRPGCAVFHAGERIGTLTSGTLSPSLGIGIGLAYLPLLPGMEVAVEVRGKHLSGRVVRPPFQ